MTESQGLSTTTMLCGPIKSAKSTGWYRLIVYSCGKHDNRGCIRELLAMTLRTGPKPVHYNRAAHIQQSRESRGLPREASTNQARQGA